MIDCDWWSNLLPISDDYFFNFKAGSQVWRQWKWINLHENRKRVWLHLHPKQAFAFAQRSARWNGFPYLQFMTPAGTGSHEETKFSFLVKLSANPFKNKFGRLTLWVKLRRRNKQHMLYFWAPNFPLQQTQSFFPPSIYISPLCNKEVMYIWTRNMRGKLVLFVPVKGGFIKDY